VNLHPPAKSRLEGRNWYAPVFGPTTTTLYNNRTATNELIETQLKSNHALHKGNSSQCSKEKEKAKEVSKTIGQHGCSQEWDGSSRSRRREETPQISARYVILNASVFMSPFTHIS